LFRTAVPRCYGWRTPHHSGRRDRAHGECPQGVCHQGQAD